jgi:hypothetical protein
MFWEHSVDNSDTSESLAVTLEGGVHLFSALERHERKPNDCA